MWLQKKCDLPSYSHTDDFLFLERKLLDISMPFFVCSGVLHSWNSSIIQMVSLLPLRGQELPTPCYLEISSKLGISPGLESSVDCFWLVVLGLEWLKLSLQALQSEILSSFMRKFLHPILHLTRHKRHGGLFFFPGVGVTMVRSILLSAVFWVWLCRGYVSFRQKTNGFGWMCLTRKLSRVWDNIRHPSG